MKEVHIA